MLRGLIDSETDSFELTRKHLVESLRFPLFAILFIWGIHFYQSIWNWDPAAYGIMSRRIWGIPGIISGPMVHGSWKHLISNTFPLFVLTALSIYFYRKVAMRAFWLIYFMTGIAGCWHGRFRTLGQAGLCMVWYPLFFGTVFFGAACAQSSWL